MQHIEGLLVKGGMDMVARTASELGREVTTEMAWGLAQRFADEYEKFTDSLTIMDSRGQYADMYRMLWKCAYTSHYVFPAMREKAWDCWGNGMEMTEGYKDSLVASVLGLPVVTFVLTYTEAQLLREGVDGRGMTCLTPAQVEITPCGEWTAIHTGDERITDAFRKVVETSRDANGTCVMEGGIDVPDGTLSLSLDAYTPGMAIEMLRKVLGGGSDTPTWWPPFRPRDIRSSGLAVSWLYMERSNTEDNPGLEGLPAFLRSLSHGGTADDITRKKHEMLCDEFYGLIADIPARDGRRQNDPSWIRERTRFIETPVAAFCPGMKDKV